MRRIVIWRQFSGNHSASFVIVGTFESKLAANRTAEKIRDILRRIARYWQQLPPDEASGLWERIHYKGEIAPVEREISRELDVEWSKDIRREMQPHGIDWIPRDPDKAVEAVTVLDNHVFIESIGDTDVGAEPFETLLRRDALSVSGNYETIENTTVAGTGLLRVSVSCLAPDQATVQALLSNITVSTWIPRTSGGGWPLPFELTWEEYHRGEYAPEPDMSIGDDQIRLYCATLDIQGLEMRYTALTFWNPKELVESLVSYLSAHGCLDIRYIFSQE